MSATALMDAPPSVGSGRWLDDGAGSRLDRLPRLSDALADVARALTENFCAIFPTPAEVTFHTLETSRVDRLLDRRGGKPVFAIARAAGWNTAVALQFDQLFVAVAVHALFGGDEEEFEFPERTSLTALESRIASLVIDQAVDAMTKGFAPTMPSTFVLEPMKPKADTLPLGRGPVNMLVATFMLHAVGQPVELDIVIPEAALAPFMDQLAIPPESDVSPDPGWSEKLEAEISRACLGIEASLLLPPMTLGQIATLEVGQVLNFEVGANTEVKLSCETNALFRCDLGQTNGCYSLKLTTALASIDPSSHKDP